MKTENELNRELVQHKKGRDTMKITMNNKLYFKLPDFSNNDPRYGEDGLNINGRTLQDLHDNYKFPFYIDNNKRTIRDSRFTVIPTEIEEKPFILVTDIGEVYGDSSTFYALAVRIGDITNDKGQAKVYTLNWKVTNKEAEKPEEKFVLKNYKIIESDYSSEIAF